ncbi:hypothetical protein Agabi119p4_2267 [Agaricus bisporus var. burnettii]|uniref:Uncharacterized protein n=1 Tax=Agaricus bisporus var. burnettii TaxID=192524 RepID=A0A8H7F8S3_AGABI|nr:hypothetical protein Agabi119p4_2267 [Agaricus bisporus var. burnettii]
MATVTKRWVLFFFRSFSHPVITSPGARPMVFSLLCSWCSCFNAEAEGEGDKKTSKNGLANGVNGAHVPEHGTSTSNQQMQPTLPPLPEIRPLEPVTVRRRNHEKFLGGWTC